MIDDGYLREKSSLKRKGYEHYRNQEDTVREMTSFDDRLVREINTTDFSRALNEEYLQLIKKRGGELVVKHPELEERIQSYIQLQSEECEVLNNDVVGTLWVVQKK